MKRVEIIVDQNGEVTYETKGVKGAGCMQETAWLDELFGKESVKSTEKTADFHRVDVVHHRGGTVRRGR